MLLLVPRIRLRSCKSSWKKVKTGAHSRNGRQPLLWHIHSTTLNIHNHTFEKQGLCNLHGLCHAGANATAKLVSHRFVWPGVGKDCRAWTRACTPCQRSKVTRHVKAPLVSFNLPSARFCHVHIDLVGPLPVSSGFRYCLNVIDVHPLAGGTPSVLHRRNSL